MLSTTCLVQITALVCVSCSLSTAVWDSTVLSEHQHAFSRIEWAQKTGLKALWVAVCSEGGWVQLSLLNPFFVFFLLIEPSDICQCFPVPTCVPDICTCSKAGCDQRMKELSLHTCEHTHTRQRCSVPTVPVPAALLWSSWKLEAAFWVLTHKWAQEASHLISQCLPTWRCHNTQLSQLE